MRSVLIISLLFIHSVIRASTIVNPRTNTPIVAQGDETLSLGFRSIKVQEALSLLYKIMTYFLVVTSHDVIWPTILDNTIFLKSQKII